ncbi:SRPBCC family protein [Chitinophaga sp. CB10]|uniref:SRPBCC family protein n=1 Tax=Chitinophaga sp. CB10 TaxID=1891659 RepID=UPI0025BB28A8|nr:SRPBCC family protein [Chitinophaga sp. CB10]
MERMHYTVHINATPHIVWDVLWDEDSYPLWTAPFSEGSRAETDWKKGSRVLFLNKNNEGMVAEIVDNVPEKFMSIRHLGMIFNGKEELPDDKSKEWIGAMENYELKEEDGGTRLNVSMDIAAEYKDFFEKVWPQALGVIKSLSEEV